MSSFFVIMDICFKMLRFLLRIGKEPSLNLISTVELNPKQKIQFQELMKDFSSDLFLRGVFMLPGSSFES